ncbi:MAG: putative DNA modification/repair radical SAM protein [Brachymonas sp.]|nr:putative DNA modification/repair radical SAM protein [Brachymonas sp.]
MNLIDKLSILADAAKYDASCASSGAAPRNARKGGVGSTESSGICHSFTPDGRCVALLKILLTNFCQYDCLYCVNRASSNVPRARFTVEEVVQLTLDFYQRNCIEGLFLSSGVIQNPDYTMEQLVRVAQTLREGHGFHGYIHLKAIPNAAPELLALAGRFADRVSVNIELPTLHGLAELAPQKDGVQIVQSMARIRDHIDEAKAAARAWRGLRQKDVPRLQMADAVMDATSDTPASLEVQPPRTVISLPFDRAGRAKPPPFAPGGQSTQMIVGADATDDRTILAASATLYGRYGLRRVYYSAFSPIPDASHALPPVAPPLLREHRLYQADWLLRYYGFTHDEIVTASSDGMLSLEHDPKMAWALANRQYFPVDLNTAPREMLLRVPGLGVRTVQRLLMARRVRRLHVDDLRRQRLPLQRVLAFVMLDGHHPGAQLDAAQLDRRLRTAIAPVHQVASVVALQSANARPAKKQDAAPGVPAQLPLF